MRKFVRNTLIATSALALGTGGVAYATAQSDVASSLTYVSYTSGVLDWGYSEISVECPAYSRVTGGGVEYLSVSAGHYGNYTAVSFPSPGSPLSSGTHDAWVAKVYQEDSGASPRARVWAICEQT